MEPNFPRQKHNAIFTPQFCTDSEGLNNPIQRHTSNAKKILYAELRFQISQAYKNEIVRFAFVPKEKAEPVPQSPLKVDKNLLSIKLRYTTQVS